MTKISPRNTVKTTGHLKELVQGPLGRAPASIATRSVCTRRSNGRVSLERLIVTQLRFCCGVPYGQNGIRSGASALSASAPQVQHQIRNLPFMG